MLNCLMNFLIEEDFDKLVKKEEFIDIIIVVYLFFVGEASDKSVKKIKINVFHASVFRAFHLYRLNLI